jgi:hypothetical protein
VICGVEKNFDLADYDQLLIVLDDDDRLLIVVAIRIRLKKGGPV